MLFALKLKRALALLLLISFFPCSVLANPENGRFSRVLKGEVTRFDAWCFDDVATAKIQATSEFARARCDLEVDQALERERAKYSLDIKNLNLRILTIEEESANILAIKNEEIERLETAALKRPNDYSHYWALGGVATGSALTVLLVFLVK